MAKDEIQVSRRPSTPKVRPFPDALASPALMT